MAQPSRETMEAKQAYLIEHIMNKGYDTTDFASYMSTKKQNGHDINNFSFDEVLEVSLKFFYLITAYLFQLVYDYTM